MAAHDLDDESARVGRSGGRDAVDSLTDAVESSSGAYCDQVSVKSATSQAGGERTDGHVRSGHVVVDTADETDNLEVLVSVVLLLRDIACEVDRQCST